MILLMLLVGLIAGALSGVIGIGGGVLIVPALVYIARMGQLRAQGTSLGVMLAPVGLLAFLEYYRAGNVDVKVCLMLCVGFLIGGYFGGSWAQHIPEALLRKTFACVMVVAAVKMFISK